MKTGKSRSIKNLFKGKCSFLQKLLHIIHSAKSSRFIQYQMTTYLDSKQDETPLQFANVL